MSLLTSTTYTIGWKEIIIFFAALFAVVIIFAVTNFFIVFSVKKHYLNNEYAKVLKFKKYLLFIGKKEVFRQSYYVMFANCCFELNNDEECILYLKRLRNGDYVQYSYYYECCYALMKGDYASFEANFAKFDSAAPTSHKDELYDNLKVLLKKSKGEQITEADIQTLKKNSAKRLIGFVLGEQSNNAVRV